MRLLLVEDERKVADVVARGLRAERYAVDVAATGDEGWAMASTYDYDLVILDLMLPGLGGLEVLRRIRKRNTQVPILILTARDATESKVENFEAGADDYLTKPFAFAELIVRVKSLLRRGPVNQQNTVRVADLEIDRLTQQVRRGGRRIELTPKEYSLLEYLASQPGRVFSRSMIVEHVWDQSFEGLTNIVDVYVRHLREKIDVAPQDKLIRTVRGVGYSLEAEPIAVNPRSLRFRLTAWYAGVLAVLFLALGAFLLIRIRSEFTHVLLTTQSRRARQIGDTLVAAADRTGESYVAREIDSLYAPKTADRFIRISRPNGTILYLSGAPVDGAFDPVQVAPAPAAEAAESSRVAHLADGRSLLVAAYRVATPAGAYEVEVGTPGEPVETAFRRLAWQLGLAVPLVILLTAAGGYVLVRGSLRPVAKMAGKAEMITQHNLSERLPVLQTGDELEALSLALNRMINRLDEAFQNSRRSVADASHELRTPLTVLRAELEQLATERPADAEWSDRVGSLLEEVERLGRIVEQLFALTRLDNGEAKSEWTTFDLGKLAQITVDQMRLLGDDRRLEVTCRTQPAFVHGDPARLKQVIVNLLDNAIKYTLPGGKIDVAVQPEGLSACLSVADTGIGISAADLPHIFDRFYRADPSRSHATEGAGLGLAIARSICLAQDGTIEATSTPTLGTRVQARFPLITSSLS